jgi:hypothetical protein
VAAALPAAAAALPAAAAAPAVDADEEAHVCVVCQDAPKSVLLLPCKHICTCDECSEAISDCPICRADIAQKITGVFITS